MKKFWKTSKNSIEYAQRTLVMGIVNMTPDSFSDGGAYFSVDEALRHAERLINDGADIIDIGGESTRPKSERVLEKIELERVIPVIKAISNRFEIPISIDTSKSGVAEKAIDAGAEIINDISGLNFDRKIAEVAANSGAGLILMHLRGRFKEMHDQIQLENIVSEVARGLTASVAIAREHEVSDDQICLDVGIGFSKTFEQNLELIAKLDELIKHLPEFPMLIGTSRKSFIGKILNEENPNHRINGSLASNAVACWNGVNIVRVHDVKETVEAIKLVDAIKREL